MSSYFGALIRSSGMRIGSADVPGGARSSTPDGIVEINEERYASSPEGSWTAPARQDDRTMSPERTMKAPADESLVADASHSTPALPAVAPAAGSPSAVSTEPAVRVHAISPAPLLAPPERRPAVPSAPAPSALDPVRLALQWIAASPETRETSTVTSRPVVPSPLAPAHVSAEVALPRLEAREVGVPVIPEARPAAPVRQPAARTIGQPPVHAIVEPASAPAAHPGRANDRADTADESLEISIGTINLHVEAPAPRTVVQPAPSQATSRPRTERSGLHRRYLRSF